MNAHRSLSRLDVLKYSPDKISMMVASEFLRASARAQYPSIVSGCFDRAWELMGILETIALDANVAQDLSPVYRRCSHDMRKGSIPVEAIRLSSLEIASVFEKAAVLLKGNSHA